MKEIELEQAMEDFSLLCDQCKAYLSHSPLKKSELDYAKTANRFSPTTETAQEIKTEAKSLKDCSFEELQCRVKGCTLCKLQSNRHNTVFGEGVMHPLLMVVGEGPGADEDATGRPFVGRGGQYLDKWLASIGLSRESNVYIANIIKCRPPENRTPEVDEVTSCIGYVKRQIELIQPKVILLSGATAAHALLENPNGVGRLRGQFYQVQGIPALVTYHPAGVLRNPDLRRPVWDDMKRIASFLNLSLPGRS
ncbi:MAG: uracil-DNA glycosylase [Sphaerochaetaceae bacterium]